jgi:hypothetical protein
MATGGTYQIHSESRGPHWIAWVTRGAETEPERSVVLVGASQQEAEANARKWAERQV